MVTKQWSDLPHELLSQVANRLRLIDLLRFRVVCKDFRSASSTATAEVETLPWFLAYGEYNTPQCTLFDYMQKSKIYSLDIPQLQGAICLASREGWLLVFRRGSMFFYCPFSNVKIDLPNFPHSKLKTYHVATFSSPPCSKDCTVFVLTRSNLDWVEVIVLERGCYNWATFKRRCRNREVFHDVLAAAYCWDALVYFDEEDTSYLFSLDPDVVKNIIANGKAPHSLPFRRVKLYSQVMGLKEVLGLKDASISICGTLIHNLSISICGTLIQLLMHNERFKTPSSHRWVKGVWIHPRFYHISTIVHHRW